MRPTQLDPLMHQPSFVLDETINQQRGGAVFLDHIATVSLAPLTRSPLYVPLLRPALLLFIVDSFLYAAIHLPAAPPSRGSERWCWKWRSCKRRAAEGIKVLQTNTQPYGHR